LYQGNRERHWYENGQRKYTPEQILGILRQVEVAVSNGWSTPQACREASIVEQTFYRWRKEYGGLKPEQAKRMKTLEKENARLRHVVAELSLEKQILKDVAEGNF
jgi:transposase-like protein